MRKGVFFDIRNAGEPSGMTGRLAALMRGANTEVASWTCFSARPNNYLLPGEGSMAVVCGRNLAGSSR